MIRNPKFRTRRWIRVFHVWGVRGCILNVAAPISRLTARRRILPLTRPLDFSPTPDSLSRSSIGEVTLYRTRSLTSERGCGLALVTATAPNSDAVEPAGRIRAHLCCPAVFVRVSVRGKTHEPIASSSVSRLFVGATHRWTSGLK